MTPDRIRNFCIIAHIDHGKTTLTDRLLEYTSTKFRRDLTSKDRLTDVLEIEQERGITIKLQPATMKWNGYELNLIDTPGHIDFTYEVSRSLKACEGALLLIDVTQGIQAQTISNLLLALEANLTVVPVINKIDLAINLIPQRLSEIKETLGFQEKDVILASGKTGEGVDQLLTAVIEKVPPPKIEKELKALVFDSVYDEHKGIIASVRVFGGTISSKNLFLAHTRELFLPREVGIYSPDFVPTSEITAGSVGYVATGVKDVKKVTIGDTIVDNLTTHPIPGYEQPEPKVFASLYPVENKDYLLLKNSVQKLALNDASLFVAEDYSPLLGQGFRMGYLGMLHLEITQERLSKEFFVETIVTVPSVEYKVTKNTGEELHVMSAYDLPEIARIKEILEPFVTADILTPSDQITSLYDTIIKHRGVVLETKDVFSSTVSGLHYVSLIVDLPFAELLKGFFNTLKSISHGYASLQYGKLSYRKTSLVKVDIYVKGEIVPPLSFLEIPEKARERAENILKNLKETIPPHMFTIPIQAAIGGKIIAREDVRSYKKDVTAKLYGGDITRKNKLRDNQKQKKKEMQSVGKVRIPPQSFISIIKQQT